MKQLLNEYKLNDIWNKEFKDIDYDEFKQFAEIDKISSDINNDVIGELGVWLARLYKQNKIKLNELISYKEELNEYFKDFNELKRRNKISNPDHKNIFKYKSIDEFFDTIDYYKNNIGNTNEINKKEYSVFYEDSDWIVIIPWTKRASIYFGRDTDWCTSKEEDKFNKFYDYVDHDYDKENVLFYNINKVTKEKYAFYFGYNGDPEFKNKKNKDINPLKNGLPFDLIKKYYSEYPNDITKIWLNYYLLKYENNDFVFYEDNNIKLIYTKDKTFKYINKKNPNDKNFNPNVLDDELRTIYFNLLKKNDYFKKVNKFDEYSKNVALAKTNNNKLIFINKQGNFADVNDIDLNKINDNEIRAAYFNTLNKNNSFKVVQKFGIFGYNIAPAITIDDKEIFINKQGNPANVNDIDLDKIDDNKIRTTYFNLLKKQNIFRKVYNFGKYGKNVGVAETYDDKHFFINKQGNLADVNDIDLDKINNSYDIAAFFNTLKKRFIFTKVYNFGIYGENVAFAYDIEYKTFFINKQGDIAKANDIDIDFDKLKCGYVRAAYFNTLKKSYIFRYVHDFDIYGIDIARAINYNSISFFINKQGNPADINDIDWDKIYTNYDRAAYFNTLKKRNIFIEVYKFGIYGENAALAETTDGKKIFINKQGNLATVNDIDWDKLDSYQLKVIYFNTIKKRNFLNIFIDINEIENIIGLGVTIDYKPVYIDKNKDIIIFNK